jgi:hypothetical protein
LAPGGTRARRQPTVGERRSHHAVRPRRRGGAAGPHPARRPTARLGGADALFTPYFHLAEVRELAPASARVVALNFVPSEETMRTLAEVPADALDR